MWTSFNATISVYLLFFVLPVGVAVNGQEVDQQERQQIGEVLGTPVYRDEIRVGKGVQLSSELHRLFTAPVAQQYRRTQTRKITPTPAEITAATKYFDNEHRKRIKADEPKLQAQLNSIEEQLAQMDITEKKREQLAIEKRDVQLRLKPPGKSFAVFMLKSWKFQRHLHKEYGGGRILFQQAGLEAFDATRKWLEALERDGKFKINDPELRSAFYYYWTKQDHGAFLTDDKERIREFVEPACLKETEQQQ